MAKIHYIYGTMASAKSTELITRAFYMESIGKKIQCLIPSLDTRSDGVISSRTGLKRDNCIVIYQDTIINDVLNKDIEVVFMDEIQFYTAEQIKEIVDISDKRNIQFFGLNI